MSARVKSGKALLPLGFGLFFGLFSAGAWAQGAPPGWELVGSNPGAYTAGTAPVGRAGQPSLVLRSTTAPVLGFGALARTVDARPFVGKRIRLSGWIRTEDVRRWAGLWMAVGRTGREVFAFDDMSDRAIGGTTDWQRYEVVLDVKPSATWIRFGALLSGSGAVYVDGLALEIAQDETTTTNRLRFYPSRVVPPEALPGGEWEPTREVLPWLL